MAITQALCTSFKAAILNGEMDFSADTTDVFRIALYTSAATLNATTTVYSATNEVSGAGYTAGGEILTLTPTATTGTTAFVDFADAVWTSSTITARGALIYKDAGGGSTAAVAVLDFGSDRTSTSGNFTVVFPTADAANAIVRIA